MNRARWWAAFKYLLGFGILAWLIWSNWFRTGEDGAEIGLSAALRQPKNYYALTAAVLICAASVLLTFVRWYVLVRAQGLPFTVAGALRLGMFGYYLNQFLPGSISDCAVSAMVWSTVYAYDTDFDTIPGVTRSEP